MITETNIKKRKPFKLLAFKPKKTNRLLSYINSMSENGLHLDKIQGSCCYFSRDDDARFLYGVSLRSDGGVYEVLGSEWKYVFSFKGVRFYRKKIACELYYEKKKFSRSKNPSKAESEWLKARHADGEMLVGHTGKEYLFDDVDTKNGYDDDPVEYRGFTVSEDLTETENRKLIELTRRGWKFLFTTNNGRRYYYSRVQSETPGSRGTVAEVATAFLGATLSLIFMFISLGGVLFTIIRSMFSGGQFDPKRILTNGVKPEWLFIIGVICTFIFGITYLVLSSAFTKRVEARRRKHARLSRLNNTQANGYQNTYSAQPEYRETGYALSGGAYRAPTEHLTPSANSHIEYTSDIGITALVFNILAILVSCAVFTACVIFCYGYFTSGTASARWILVPAFLGICFFPFIVYGSAEKCVAFILARRRK